MIKIELMQLIKYIRIIIPLVVIIMTQSCKLAEKITPSVQKRKYNKGYYIEFGKKSDYLNPENIIETRQNNKTNGNGKKLSKEKIESKEITVLSDDVYFANSVCKAAKTSNDHKLVNADLDYFYIEKYSECDTIFLKSGKIILAVVKEILNDEIRYKRCNYTEGPEYTIEKKKVSDIIRADGLKIAVHATEESTTKKFEIFAATSFLAALLSIGPAAIYMAVLSFKRFKKEPDKYKGKVFAYIGMILGIISTLFMLFMFSFAVYVFALMLLG